MSVESTISSFGVTTHMGMEDDFQVGLLFWGKNGRGAVREGKGKQEKRAIEEILVLL